jgi:hypothetical protein
LTTNIATAKLSAVEIDGQVLERNPCGCCGSKEKGGTGESSQAGVGMRCRRGRGFGASFLNFFVRGLRGTGTLFPRGQIKSFANEDYVSI